MQEKVLFKAQIMVRGEPEEIEKIEAKLLNLTKKQEVVSSYISKFYQQEEEKMKTYRWCNECGGERPVEYDFTKVAWVCMVCGKEITKIEDEIWTT